MSQEISQTVVRRLAAAEGYMELGLPGYALLEIDHVDQEGPFEAIANLLKGEALQAQERYEEAIEPLHRAAAMFPAPYNQRAWSQLGNCYRQTGHEDLAVEVETAMKESQESKGAPGVVVQVLIAPAFTVDQGSSRRRM